MSDSTVPIRPYQPDSRINEVETRIREYIANNHLQAGDRLPGESWFAAQLEVGRPLIREALKGLEAVGMIEARKGVGRFMRAFDADAYLRSYATNMLLSSFSEQELNETRCLLEISMVADSVSRLTDDDLVELDQIAARLAEVVAADESDVAADFQLHRLLMRRSENRLVISLHDAVYALAVRRREARPVHSLDHLQADYLEHIAIIEAAARRDGQAARAALVNHFRTTATRLGFGLRWRDVFAIDPVGLET